MRSPNGFDFKDLMTFGLFILALLFIETGQPLVPRGAYYGQLLLLCS